MPYPCTCCYIYPCFFLISSQGSHPTFQCKNTIRLLSCDVCGLNQYDKCQKITSHFLFPFVHHKPDIFTFQESHSSPETSAQWAVDFGIQKDNLLSSHGNTRSRGVILGWSHKFKILSSRIDTEGRYIVASMKGYGEKFTLVPLYLEPGLSISEVFRILGEVMGFAAETENARTMFIGDFNAILDPILDTSSSRATASACGRRLADFMDTHELTDIWRVGHEKDVRYSCFTGPVSSHSDLALASPSFLTHVVNCSIETSYPSDHASLYIYVEFNLDQDPRGRGLWCVPTHVLGDTVYQKRIENLLTSGLHQEASNLDPLDRMAAQGSNTKSYSDKLVLMHWEHDQLVKYHTSEA